MAPRHAPAANGAAAQQDSGIQAALHRGVSSYSRDTPKRLRLIDAYLVFLMLTGILIFAYCVIVSSFPFNAFLASFASTVGQFVLAGALRMQVNPANKKVFAGLNEER